MSDNVHKPSHYSSGNIEVIEYIDDQLKDGKHDFYMGNILKYVSRYKHKNGVEDLNKAKWYLERLIKSLEVTHE